MATDLNLTWGVRDRMIHIVMPDWLLLSNLTLWSTNLNSTLNFFLLLIMHSSLQPTLIGFYNYYSKLSSNLNLFIWASHYNNWSPMKPTDLLIRWESSLTLFISVDNCEQFHDFNLYVDELLTLCLTTFELEDIWLYWYGLRKVNYCYSLRPYNFQNFLELWLLKTFDVLRR